MALNKINKNMIQGLPEELNGLTEQLAEETIQRENQVSNLETTMATKTELTELNNTKANNTDVRFKNVPIGLNDAASDLLAAVQNIEGETTFNLLSIPRPNSVTPYTTTFLKRSNNMFNKNDVTLNKSFADIDGSIIESTTRAIVNTPIPILPGQNITRSYSSLVVRFTNENNAWVRTSTFSASALTFQVPEGCYFMELSVSKTSIDTLMVNLGDVLLPYENFSFELQSNNQYPLKVSSELITASVESIQDEIDETNERLTKLNERLLPFRGNNYIQSTTYTQLIDSLSNTGCTIEQLGLSSDGVNHLYGISYGDLATKPVIFLIGNQHGMEWFAAHYPLDFMTRIAKSDFYDTTIINKLRDTFAFYTIVSANPWGYINSTYTNANGVNLNRNWDKKWDTYPTGEGTIQYKGTSPFSEPETQIIRDKILTLQPYMIIDCHASDGKGGIYTGTTEYGSVFKETYSELIKIFNDAALPVQEWKVGDSPTATGWAIEQDSKEGTNVIPCLIEQPMTYSGNYGLTTLFALSLLAYSKYVI